MPVIHNDLLLSSDTATGYNLTKSLRFRSSASAYLSRTPATTGTGAAKLWTFSAWIKRGALALGGGAYQEIVTGKSGASTYGYFGFDNNDKFVFNQSNSGSQQALTTTQVFRDTSAWYHIIVVYDSAQATSSNRAKIYVNGTQVTSFSTATYPSQNYVCDIMRNNQTTISSFDGTSEWLDGYIAETYFVDGQALTPSEFGETDAITGVWKPKRYTGTYGTNGFYLPFTDVATTSGSNAGLGKDFSGNGNYWNTNNISVTAGTTYDSMTDVPTLTSPTAANYAVLQQTNSTATVSNGNLTSTAGASYLDALASIACNAGSGKWYFEGTVTAFTTTAWIGVTRSTNSGLDHTAVDSYRTVYQANGSVYRSGTGLGDTATGVTYTTNDVIGIALDSITGSISFYKNNTLVNTTTDALYASNSFFFYTGQNAATWAVNFGQRPFAYTPPTGFKALNTYNLPDSTIVAGNKVMDATLYTGNNTARSITNTGGFKPDLLWFARRSLAGNLPVIDSNRGITKVLISSGTAAEQTSTAGTGVTALNSNGFSLGTDLTTHGSTNTNGETYVAWQWQAGQGTTSTNTSGTITSTVSVNASAGFSIVTWTGATGTTATVGHGLGVAPKFIIVKNRTNGYSWITWISGVTSSSQFLYLNATDAISTISGYWGGTPTSTTFPVNSTYASINESGSNFVACCWSEVAGFSKFGSFTANASADGPFIYCGFRPKYVLFKKSSGSGDWMVLDSARDTYNVELKFIVPNSNAVAEGSTQPRCDFLSNGIKVRAPSGYTPNETSGDTYIYAAFAENPFKNSLAR